MLTNIFEELINIFGHETTAIAPPLNAVLLMKALFSREILVELITNIAPPEPSIAVLFKKVLFLRYILVTFLIYIAPPLYFALFG